MKDWRDEKIKLLVNDLRVLLRDALEISCIAVALAIAVIVLLIK